MEAMVAERGTEMTEWNEGRLDDLSERVDRIETKMDSGFARADQKMDAGFARLEAKMDEGFARMDAKFDAFNERFDTMYQTLFKASWALVIGILGLLGVLIGVIATQS
jgi:chromosome segregation ATPase